MTCRIALPFASVKIRCLSTSWLPPKAASRSTATSLAPASIWRRAEPTPPSSLGGAAAARGAVKSRRRTAGRSIATAPRAEAPRAETCGRRLRCVGACADARESGYPMVLLYCIPIVHSNNCAFVLRGAPAHPPLLTQFSLLSWCMHERAVAATLLTVINHKDDREVLVQARFDPPGTALYIPSINLPSFGFAARNLSLRPASGGVQTGGGNLTTHPPAPPPIIEHAPFDGGTQRAVPECAVQHEPQRWGGSWPVRGAPSSPRGRLDPDAGSSPSSPPAYSPRVQSIIVQSPSCRRPAPAVPPLATSAQQAGRSFHPLVSRAACAPGPEAPGPESASRG
jgi:hypothetical protein